MMRNFVLILTDETYLVHMKDAVIPEPGREILLNLLHNGTSWNSQDEKPGKLYLWWPGTDEVIEIKVRGCEYCPAQSAMPAVAPLHPWEWPDQHCSIIHADYAIPCIRSRFLTHIASGSRSTIHLLLHLK